MLLLCVCTRTAVSFIRRFGEVSAGEWATALCFPPLTSVLHSPSSQRMDLTSAPLLSFYWIYAWRCCHSHLIPTVISPVLLEAYVTFILLSSPVWGKQSVSWVWDLPCVHRHSCTGGWVWERDWCSSRYMVGCINVEGINKVLAQWIWTVSWKGWELLISVAHWFKKGQEIATRLQLWGGLSKALCWCKEELKSLRYYTSKGAAWGFRKKKTGKGICRHI